MLQMIKGDKQTNHHQIISLCKYWMLINAHFANIQQINHKNDLHSFVEQWVSLPRFSRSITIEMINLVNSPFQYSLINPQFLPYDIELNSILFTYNINVAKQMRKYQQGNHILSNKYNRQKPIHRSTTTYQRQKSSLVQQILAFYHQQRKSSTSIPQINNSHKQYLLHYLNDQHRDKYYQDQLHIQIRMNREEPTGSAFENNNCKYLDQYIRDCKNIQQKRDQLIQGSFTDKYQIIDAFVKHNQPQNITPSKTPIVQVTHEHPQHKSKKEGQNQSTMILSQFYRSVQPTQTDPPKILEANQTNRQANNRLSNKYQISHSPRGQDNNKPDADNKLVFNSVLSKNDREKNSHTHILNSNHAQSTPAKPSQKPKLKSIDSRITQEFVKQKQTYNYDQEDNIFDGIKCKGTLTPSQLRQQFKDSKQVFRISNEDGFRKQVISEGYKFNNKQKKVINKRPKQALFNGNQQSNLRKYYQKKLINEAGKKNEQSIVASYQPKQSILASNSPKQTSQKGKETVSINNKSKDRAESILSMKVELSHQDSSYSQHSQQQFNQEGIAKLNNIVNQSIKTVTLNIDKLQAYRSKFITHLHPQTTPIPKNQSSHNIPQPYDFKKVFGQMVRVKSDQQQNISRQFFAGQNEGQISRPSSVHKRSQSKWQDKSLQGLSSSKVGELIDKDAEEQYSMNEVILSEDAISFSKFGDATVQHQTIPELRSKATSMVSIQANPLQVHQQNSAEEQLDLDDLQDYQSDEEHRQNHKHTYTLQPVQQDEMEQTLLKNNRIHSKPSNILSRKDSHKKAQECLPNVKKASQPKAQKSSQLFQISRSSISKVKGQTSIKNGLLQKDESVVQQCSNELDAGRELMQSIRNDLSNLKNKIQLSFNLQKEMSGISFTSNAKAKSQIQKITVQLKSNQSKDGNKQGSLSKIFDEHSSVDYKKEVSSDKNNRSQIDFERINQQSCNQYYNQFKQDFTNLKKRMLLDAGML